MRRLRTIGKALAPAFLGFIAGMYLPQRTKITIDTRALPGEGWEDADWDNRHNLTTASRIRAEELRREIGAIQKAERALDGKVLGATRLLCWVMHDPLRHQARDAILRTWGKRCGILLFMTGTPKTLDENVPSHVKNKLLEKGKLKNSPKVGQRVVNSTIPRHGEKLLPNAVFIVLDLQDHYRNLWQRRGWHSSSYGGITVGGLITLTKLTTTRTSWWRISNCFSRPCPEIKMNTTAALTKRWAVTTRVDRGIL